MSKVKFSLTGGGTNRTRKLVILLLSSFSSLTPIMTIIACNKKDQSDDRSDNNKTVELLNQIKTEINNEFNQKKSSVLDYKSFVGLSKAELFRILENYYSKMTNVDNIEIDNSNISQYFINETNEQLRIMNTKLKNDLTQLSNLPFDIVSIGSTKLFLEKLTYNQLLEVIRDLGQNINYNISESPSKVFKLKFNLSFKIKIDNIREDDYIFSGIQHFITDNAKDIFSKLVDISNSVRSKLTTANINLEHILNSQGELVGNLNQKFIDAIKTTFIKNNSGLNIKFDNLWTPTPIKEEDLRITLNSLKHTNDDGTANDKLVEYYKNFIQILLKSEPNIIKTLYTDNKELKAINGDLLPNSGPIKIKNFSYIPLNLSINDINIPMVNPINTFLIFDYANLIKYLVQFGNFLDEYFTLIKAGEVQFISDASRKVVTIQKDSMSPNWSKGPVRALETDFQQIILPKMENKNKQYFKMNFNGVGDPKHLNQGVHWWNVRVKFIFKVFTINFLDDEQIRFKYE